MTDTTKTSRSLLCDACGMAEAVYPIRIESDGATEWHRLCWHCYRLASARDAADRAAARAA